MEYSELDAKLEPHEKPGCSLIEDLRAAVARCEELHRAKPKRHEKPDWSFFNSLGAARRFFRKAVVHMAEGRGGLAELAALVEARDEMNAAIDASAKVLLAAEHVSYAEIGAALGVTKQAVSLRYPGASARPVGGQHAGNRTW